MFQGDKNLNKTNIKDSSLSTDHLIRDTSLAISYTKTNKLITALYMVTDMMDTDEPIRLRLRTLGVEILSDINSLPRLPVTKKIHEVVSFLDIASTVGIVSGMNAGILRKEFLRLESALNETIDSSESFTRQIDLREFFKDEERGNLLEIQKPFRHDFSYKGHLKPTRIGVQKGHSLMKALSDRIPELSNIKEKFDQLKKERRDEIIKIIKDNPNGSTITDIKTKSQGVLRSVGEKTLQRELISMVRDNVLNKTGEKRWSKYFLPPNQPSVQI